jgi:hypothetical protein
MVKLKESVSCVGGCARCTIAQCGMPESHGDDYEDRRLLRCSYT